MLLSPTNAIPLDPDEFIGAFEYAQMVAKYEFLEEIPAIGKPFVPTVEGLLALTNVFETRFALAVLRHFRNQEEKFMSFMLRFLALRRLFKHPSMTNYLREAGDGYEIHGGVFEVAATQELSDTNEFGPEAFFQKMCEVAAQT